MIAVGVFDGVHRGHRAILEFAARRARAIDAEPVVVTFHPHPLSVLRPGQEPQLLLSLDQRRRHLAEAGVRRVAVIPFTRRFSAWPPERFLKQVLVRRLGAREVVVGHDFRFGRGRSGTVETLKQGGRRLGFTAWVVGPVRLGGRRVSSGEIRRRVASGDLAGARRMLGRPPSVVGRVVRGAGRGAKLGFPTANVHVEAGVLPPVGVYAVRARIGTWHKTDLRYQVQMAGLVPGTELDGMANIGYRPTFGRGTHWYRVRTRYGDENPVLEVHLFRTRVPDLRGRRLEVEFIRRLRPERRFASAAALARQLARDASRARRLL
ncbi:MAG: riboflavin biosynthesis protein RibF [Candidatus Omnitrophica bacterium]|nr:riboflavin biosynthesis protein RibF [Candidatus Omnitrophota bacterium]